MDLFHDLANIFNNKMLAAGITVPTTLDDSKVVSFFLELKQRWINQSLPYMVVYSRELRMKYCYLPEEEQHAIKTIEECFAECKPLAPYLSKLISETDVGKSDFLLKNWGINHVHLEERTITHWRFTNPNLLLFIIKGKVVHFIDVVKHPTGAEWFNREWIEIINSNWPWLLSPIGGMIPTQRIPDNQRHKLSKRIVAALDFHGESIMPSNFGVTLSGNSVKATLQTQRIKNELQRMEKQIQKRDAEIKKEIKDKTGIEISTTSFSLQIKEGRIYANEETTDYNILLFPKDSWLADAIAWEIQ